MRHLLVALGVLMLSPAIALACPVAGQGVEVIALTEADMGEDPYRVPVIAGGDVDLSQCGYPAGFVITVPDFSFDMTGIYGPIQVSVDSPGCDTVLLVNGADGSWYYDDDSSGDLMPWLEVVADDGRMDVWIGTYGGDFCDAQVVLY